MADSEAATSSNSVIGPGGFKYDPISRRIEKITSRTTSIYAYDLDTLIDETNSSGAAVGQPHVSEVGKGDSTCERCFGWD